ncbi:Longitudinals lacking protein, isoforms A/B/D/L [Frankliniella fusca]|uniref:Longitudinals lacking protein, isoforms A/B/D/L n=1 Tax=Frankliniella fusca TaxID=407009 RepID=A0AAE1H627_9NEOP|nr:Longitudinals lacking protein, isoforms A/B/D/L [Frankliniella fusca]
MLAHVREDCGGSGVRYECHLCPYSTKRARNLPPHVLRVHGPGAVLPTPATAASAARRSAAAAVPAELMLTGAGGGGGEQWLLHPDQDLDQAQYGQAARQPGNYPCPQCGKVYRWKWNLVAHLREDCGREAQYRCAQCNYTAKRERNLELHVARKHKEPRPCPRGAPRLPRHAGVQAARLYAAENPVAKIGIAAELGLAASEFFFSRPSP